MAMILTVGDKPDLSRALAIIESVLVKLPNNPSFRETRGEIYVRMGRWQEAVADLEFALPLLASKQGTHKALAEAYRGLACGIWRRSTRSWPAVICQKRPGRSSRRNGVGEPLDLTTIPPKITIAAALRQCCWCRAGDTLEKPWGGSHEVRLSFCG